MHGTTVKKTLVRSNKTQVYFNSNFYIYTWATSFGMYLGHPQARQYKTLQRKI